MSAEAFEALEVLLREAHGDHVTVEIKGGAHVGVRRAGGELELVQVWTLLREIADVLEHG